MHAPAFTIWGVNIKLNNKDQTGTSLINHHPYGFEILARNCCPSDLISPFQMKKVNQVTNWTKVKQVS